MLSWVFWHARREDVSEVEYRQHLLAFHRQLLASAPPGLLGVRCFRHAAVPWLPVSTEVHEDWYHLEDSAALDRLDAQVVVAPVHDAHANVSRLAVTATAGLYRLQPGAPPTRPTHAAWLSKPRGEAYPAFLAGLPPSQAVWSRALVLGPTPEFCVEFDAAPPPAFCELAACLLQPRPLASD